jgi:hypothetical protein
MPDKIVGMKILVPGTYSDLADEASETTAFGLVTTQSSAMRREMEVSRELYREGLVLFGSEPTSESNRSYFMGRQVSLS